MVIEEIQKAPQLLDVVSAQLEERPELRFVLTGCWCSTSSFLLRCGCHPRPATRGPLDEPQEIEGLALETLVAQHLRAFAQLRRRGDSLRFGVPGPGWR